MQIDPRFYKQDERRQQEKRDKRRGSAEIRSDISDRYESNLTDSDSDESIRAIKRNQQKNQVRIDLNDLSDAEIAKLTMNQINNLLTEPKVLTSIPKDDQAAVLLTEWLKPIRKYTKWESFGERSLEPDIVDYRAGTAVCLTDCQLMSLGKEDYKRFVLKIEQKHQMNVNTFLKTLPFFSFWPTKQLNRLQYFLKEEKFIRGQEVYREGSDSKHVYLICEGEFLLTKRVPVREQAQVKLEKLMGPNQAAL